jgi:hypothetical protein
MGAWLSSQQRGAIISARIAYAYRSMTHVREFIASDDLSGDDVLPGFAVKVAGLFEE